MKEVIFKLVSRENPIISIEGYVDMEEGSDYCLNFYDQFDDICLRIPLNPFNYYCDEYYAYVDLVYAFETDEAFMPLLKEFVESEFKKFKFMRPNYNLVLEKGD